MSNNVKIGDKEVPIEMIHAYTIVIAEGFTGEERITLHNKISDHVGEDHNSEWSKNTLSKFMDEWISRPSTYHEWISRPSTYHWLESKGYDPMQVMNIRALEELSTRS